jgi:hypothetical protein
MTTSASDLARKREDRLRRKAHRLNLVLRKSRRNLDAGRYALTTFNDTVVAGMGPVSPDRPSHAQDVAVFTLDDVDRELTQLDGNGA